MQYFAVFGHPIGHSKSPRIHQLFAEETGLELSYKTQQPSLELFEQAIEQFFVAGASGANITTPFKERAFHYCNELTERARLAGAVNTIKPLADGCLLGDNTDGIGLLSDLQRLNMIRSRSRVLLVGAGGAARGAILPLLELQCKLIITNRTYAKAKQLVDSFQPHGDISASGQSELANQRFDLVINATTSGLQGGIPDLPIELVAEQTAFYDMFYQAQLTPFLVWAKQHGAKCYADGLGMLVGQAAHAFMLWHNVMPEVEPVLAQLRRELRLAS